MVIQVITTTVMMIGRKDMGNDVINAMVLAQLLTKANVIAVSIMAKHGLNIVQDAYVMVMVFE